MRPRLERLRPAPFLLGKAGPSFEAFGQQSVWRVDQVMWGMASPNSPYVLDYVRREVRATDGGLISRVDLLCWPDQGPYWHETPSWAPSKLEDSDG